MSEQNLWFVTFIVEKTAQYFFGGDLVCAYSALADSGMLKRFVDTYETSHRLGVGYLMLDVKECFDREKLPYEPSAEVALLC